MPSGGSVHFSIYTGNLCKTCGKSYSSVLNFFIQISPALMALYLHCKRWHFEPITNSVLNRIDFPYGWHAKHCLFKSELVIVYILPFLWKNLIRNIKSMCPPDWFSFQLQVISYTHGMLQWITTLQFYQYFALIRVERIASCSSGNISSGFHYWFFT